MKQADKIIPFPCKVWLVTLSYGVNMLYYSCRK